VTEGAAQVVDPEAAVYEISDYVAGVEQLTTWTLHEVVGGVSLRDALTSRFRIAIAVRGDQDKLEGDRREPVREDPHR
jgi:regulator of protease activity HflC (stomatin/prohibitin superfamily)